jgi:hypothetical protein
MPRQQLPPQIKKITLKNGNVRYHVKENGRVDPITKRRPKLDKRFDTAHEARDALRDFQYQTARGTYVMRSTLTVEQACANWRPADTVCASRPRPPTAMVCNHCATGAAKCRSRRWRSDISMNSSPT